ncbi:MAG: hypothetical protein CMO26_22910 [Thiotrichales bacterium]|nr:hypothetical protein [Thiotrichales bacterium]
MIDKRIIHPSAWKPADFTSKDTFSIDLSRGQVEAFGRALSKLASCGPVTCDGIDANGFDLQSIAGDIDRWYQELSTGRGMLNLRGFPVDEHPVEHITAMLYGLSSQWGTPVSQSVMGDRLGEVIAVDKLLHGERRRSYKSTHEMRLHSDFCDVLGMLCIRSAERGGASRYTSMISVHNKILETRPELLEPLYRGFYFWRIGEWPEEPVTPYRVPVFSETDGVLSAHYAGDLSFIDPNNTGHALSELDYEAIEYFVEVAESEELRYEFQIEPGECLFANNLTHLHARSKILNGPDVERRRHMLRVWVDCDQSFRPAVPELRVFEHGIGVSAHPEMMHA